MATLRSTLTNGSLPGLAQQAAREFGEKVAITVDGSEITHRDLDVCARRVAGWLIGRGLRRGDRVLFSTPSRLDFIVAYLGVLHAGGVAVFANPTSTSRELRTLIERAGPVVAFADAAGAELLTEAGVGRVVSLETDFESVVTQGPRIPGPVASSGDLAHLLFTSGTTGQPKGVPLSHSNLTASITSAMWAWRWSSDDVLVHALPLSHGHGLSGLHTAWVAGSTVHVLAQFDPVTLPRKIAATEATVLFAVPAMYERLVNCADSDPAHFGSLRLAITGSAPMPQPLARRVADLIGQLPLERYGTTESGYNLANPYEGIRRQGTVGFALPGAEVVLADRHGRPVPAGQEGEIAVRGPQVFSGYWEERGRNKCRFPGGWFGTGDLGRLVDGYVQVTGRLKDIIITGGMNVSPREIESVFEEHPAIARAAVVGAPSDRWGEEVVVFVVPTNAASIDVEELTEYARSLLASYKRPKRILALDELPTNHLGKVLRNKLVALVETR